MTRIEGDDLRPLQQRFEPANDQQAYRYAQELGVTHIERPRDFLSFFIGAAHEQEMIDSRLVSTGIQFSDEENWELISNTRILTTGLPPELDDSEELYERLEAEGIGVIRPHVGYRATHDGSSTIYPMILTNEGRIVRVLAVQFEQDGINNATSIDTYRSRQVGPGQFAGSMLRAIEASRTAALKEMEMHARVAHAAHQLGSVQFTR
jgi:hypothetical protein